MYTLKTTLTAIALLFTITAFSQTKEETLEWLNQNNSYCNVSFEKKTSVHFWNFTFYEDYFVKEFKFYYGSYISNDLSKVYYKDILLQDISKLDESNNSETNPPITYIEILVSKYYYKGNDDVSYEEQDGNRFSFGYPTGQPNARKNLEKVLRAIMHMAELHGAEPYKDLFGE
jgi:hypothetical protein